MSNTKLRKTASANSLAKELANGHADIVSKPGAGNTSRHGFKYVLLRLAMPAIRLHRYRNARARMLQEVFSDLDCGN